MSRAFVNEDEQQEVPFVAPRADLPEGITNYVTPFGMEALMKEKEELLAELKRLNEGNDIGQLIATKVVNLKLQNLEKRIVTANVVPHEKQDKSEVRFGSTVLLQIGRSTWSFANEQEGGRECHIEIGAGQQRLQSIGDRVGRCFFTSLRVFN